MPFTLCYNIPTAEVKENLQGILELFLGQWVNNVCIGEANCSLDRDSTMIKMTLSFELQEDAMLVSLSAFPDIFPKFTPSY